MEKTHIMLIMEFIMDQIRQMGMGIPQFDAIALLSIANSNGQKLDGEDPENTRKIIYFHFLLEMSTRIFAIMIKIKAIVSRKTFDYWIKYAELRNNKNDKDPGKK